MHKTKEVRSACATGIGTPAETTHQEEKTLKKNDLLLQVVKSNNFQKLLTSRSKKINSHHKQKGEEPMTRLRICRPLCEEGGGREVI